MTDPYEKIRKALAKGPTQGPWIVTHELRECDETVCDLVNGTWIVTAPGVKLAHWEHDAAHIAACNPDTIRELLAERDQLADALEAAREDAERLALEPTQTVDLSQCSQVTRHLIREMIQRDAHGRAKYGTTLDREDLSPEQWLQHLKEELLDGAGYAEACIRKLHKSKESN